MKAVLEFDLSLGSDDRYEWETYMKANEMRRAIDDLRDLLRKYRKYHEFSNDEVHEFFHKIDDEIIELLSDSYID